MRKQTVVLLGSLGLLAWFYYSLKSGQQWAVSAVCSAISTVTNMFPSNWLSYGSAYLPYINSVEQQWGLPANYLAAVAYQESGFNPQAVNSSSGATGMFQLMPQFYPNAGQSWQADAQTAARALNSYYAQFGDWQLALAAYNWGPGNVASAANSGSLSLTALPSETQNYVTRIAQATGVTGGLV